LIDGSQTQTAGEVTSAPALNGEGSAASLTVHVVYAALSVKRVDLDSLLTAFAQKQAGAGVQIYTNGYDGLVIIADTSANDSGAAKSFRVKADAYGGDKIDTAALAKKLVGKRYSDAMDIAGSEPNVQKAEIAIQPPWAGSLPSRTSKIKITIKVNGIGK